MGGANRPDKERVEATFESTPVDRPAPSANHPQDLSADKGYDFPVVRDLVAWWGYTAHIPVKKKKGQDAPKPEKIPGYRARRWVVERTHSWMNRFRRLLIRWEKKVPNYKAFLHFACAWITYKAAGVLG
ncbi:MAG: Mobile element protein [Gemmataceae bacterium]|nr:Mobile element protein [Gemmataceae bacterium]